MISLQRSKEILSEGSLSKKRKLDDNDDPKKHVSEQPDNIIKSLKPASAQTHHFPLDWQRCLDLKSGQIYFYNAKTNKKSFGDPKSSDDPETCKPAPMSLELQLNLSCQSDQVDQHNKYKKHDYCTTSTYPNNRSAITKSPSWLTFEADDEQEKMTAVCSKCYMLVMMSKSCPACPNCKFLHPLGLSSNTFS